MAASDSRSDDLDVEDEVVVTTGVQSTVVDEDGDEVGHAMLLDADDSPPTDVYQLATSIEGITVVAESSPGSYHLWTLSVDDLDDVVLRMLDLSTVDVEHVRQSYRRGYAVLRYGAKINPDTRERYKSPPTLLDVLATPSDLPQSRPHFEALLSLAREQGARDVEQALLALRGSDEFRWSGDERTLLTDQYATVTDAAKEVWE